MAITKSLIFSGITINGVSYTQHLTEDATVELTELSSTIEDGQTIYDAYDVSFSANLYDTDIATDTNIVTDTTVNPVKVPVVFVGATGAATLTVTNVIVNGKKVFDKQRVAWNIMGTKRSTSVDLAVTESA